MAIENRDNLKSYFEHGDKPTQQQFSTLIDSSINSIDDKATLADVETGTDNDKFITPAIAKQAIETMSPLKSVNGKFPIDGNITINTGSSNQIGSVEIGIANFYIESQSSSDIFHIRLPYKKSIDDAMYHIKAEGYCYGSAEIIDIIWVGYCYPPAQALAQVKTHINRSTTITAGQYVGSDDHVYLWLKVPYINVTAFRLDSMRVYLSPPLQPGDIQITANSQSQL